MAGTIRVDKRIDIPYPQGDWTVASQQVMHAAIFWYFFDMISNNPRYEIVDWNDFDAPVCNDPESDPPINWEGNNWFVFGPRYASVSWQAKMQYSPWNVAYADPSGINYGYEGVTTRASTIRFGPNADWDLNAKDFETPSQAGLNRAIMGTWGNGNVNDVFIVSDDDTLIYLQHYTTRLEGSGPSPSRAYSYYGWKDSFYVGGFHPTSGSNVRPVCLCCRDNASGSMPPTPYRWLSSSETTQRVGFLDGDGVYQTAPPRVWADHENLLSWSAGVDLWSPDKDLFLIPAYITVGNTSYPTPAGALGELNLVKIATWPYECVVDNGNWLIVSEEYRGDGYGSFAFPWDGSNPAAWITSCTV